MPEFLYHDALQVHITCIWCRVKEHTGLTELAYGAIILGCRVLTLVSTLAWGAAHVLEECVITLFGIFGLFGCPDAKRCESSTAPSLGIEHPCLKRSDCQTTIEQRNNLLCSPLHTLTHSQSSQGIPYSSVPYLLIGIQDLQGRMTLVWFRLGSGANESECA